MQYDGTTTFLFTDIEGSTRLWEERPDAMRDALAAHDALIAKSVAEAGGVVFKTIGDAFCAAFPAAPAALNAALTIQIALHGPTPSDAVTLRVRMALHSGDAERRDGDYFGPPLNRVARLLAVGSGGQTLVSETTRALAADALPPSAGLLALGAHRLKDLSRPELVCQLTHPSLPAFFPPLRSLGNPALQNNLPQQMTSFVGREREMETVRTLLKQSRLLTLTGSGGCGKTRLALQVAAELIEDFADGVWLAELAAIGDAALVPQAIAGVLGVAEQPGKTVTECLHDHLASRRLLLIVDNCEHLLDAAATLADVLLRGCPELRILATSREGLNLTGETAYRVPSLSLPAPTQHPAPEELTRFEAVRLFVDRAVSHLPTFRVSPKNARALSSVCARLDGIPLALELAAARVRSLPVEDIDGRLDDRFRLLTGGSRTALPRQQTLRALIDWSYDLLSEAEKTLLRRFSVFAGGWTLEAAEAVGIEENGPTGEVFDLLSALVDKSLVIFDESETENRRYRLLETVRQYARDRLFESGESEEIRTRHRAYFVTLLEKSEAESKGPQQQAWLEKLESEHDNLRAALDWRVDDAALHLAGMLWWFWYIRSCYAEGRERLTRLLAETGDAAPSVARAKVANGAGAMASSQGDDGAARFFFEQALTILRAVDEPKGLAASLNNFGVTVARQGDLDAARAAHEEALALRRKMNDPWGIANSMSNLGSVLRELGDILAARRLYEEALTASRAQGDTFGTALCLMNLGHVSSMENNLTEAMAHYKESLTLYEKLGDVSNTAYALSNLGSLTQETGNLIDARACYVRALTLHRELGDLRGVAAGLDCFAHLAAAQNRLVRAARLWGACDALRAQKGLPPAPSDRVVRDQHIADARARLGDAAFQTAWNAGHASALASILDESLASDDASEARLS